MLSFPPNCSIKSKVSGEWVAHGFSGSASLENTNPKPWQLLTRGGLVSQFCFLGSLPQYLSLVFNRIIYNAEGSLTWPHFLGFFLLIVNRIRTIVNFRDPNHSSPEHLSRAALGSVMFSPQLSTLWLRECVRNNLISFLKAFSGFSF